MDEDKAHGRVGHFCFAGNERIEEVMEEVAFQESGLIQLVQLATECARSVLLKDDPRRARLFCLIVYASSVYEFWS